MYLNNKKTVKPVQDMHQKKKKKKKKKRNKTCVQPDIHHLNGKDLLISDSRLTHVSSFWSMDRLPAEVNTADQRVMGGAF